jgi:hypothetical protein
MRPEDRRAAMAGSASLGEPLPPLDADLVPLDEELAAAGVQARRSLHGRTQPTRVFSSALRDRLVGAVAAPTIATAGAATYAAPIRGAVSGSRVRGGPEPGEAWAPRPLEPRLARRTPTVLPRARWTLLAAAALTGVVVVGAMGARLVWPVPAPTARPTAPTASTQAAVVPVTTTGPATEPTTGPSQPSATPRPEPTPTKKPTATPKPEPTDPPIVPMSLAAKACPGGVVLDWTKPSPAVGHYHVLRSFEGVVAPSYPAPGATEVESATSWSAGITDGFDASFDGGGNSATYRAFAFDASDHLMAFSPTATVTTVAAISLGSLQVVDNGDGSMTVAWSAADLPDGCFTYGKLVASAEDPDPSYLKGSPYLAVIGDPGTTAVTIDAVSSGTWLRYELIRGTGTGKFVVGRTAVWQVPNP